MSGAPVTGLTIRRAASTDYRAIDGLIAEAYAHDYGERSGGGSDPMRLSERRDDAYDVWVAVDEGEELLGSVTLRRAGGPPLHEDVPADELDLRLLGVSPRARRRGVGAALMGHAAEVAAASGLRAVALKTGPEMHAAHRLYESLGFSRAPERDGLWIGGERVLDLFTYVLPVAADPAAVDPIALDPAAVDPAALRPEDLTDQAVARGVLGRFPTGVVVVTGGQDTPAAIVLQSFVSLSIDPPRVLLSVGHGSTSWPRIDAGGTFAATVLGERQGGLARAIAGSRSHDKLADIDTDPAPAHGHPVLRGGAAWFECAIRERFNGGDHTLVVADVLGFGQLPEADRPLVFAGSRFTGLRED